MCDIQLKVGFVLNFAKNAYLHNPKNSKDDFNTWYNSKNLKIPKHYPSTLVQKLHGIVSKLKKIKEDGRHLNQNILRRWAYLQLGWVLA